MKDPLDDRLRRYQIDAKVVLSSRADALRERTWVAMTSSHLGHSTRLHAEVCRYISRSMIDARQAGRVLLVASGSAIEPWATRAAALYSVPMILVHLNDSTVSNESLGNNSLGNQANAGEAQIKVCSDCELNRDSIVVTLADRVDCVFSRPKGYVEKSLRLRLDHEHQPGVRVAIHEPSIDKRSRNLAHALMGCGAIGWYCRPADAGDARRDRDRRENPPLLAHPISSEWATTEGEWLVHCTRMSSGPWPGQSEQQHRDELLLRSSATAISEMRTPLASLCRILRMSRLVGSAIASDREWPVVCFSEQSLATLLSRRRYRSHLHRWDYEPYGIAIRKSAAFRAGFQPVIYGCPGERKSIPEPDQYRFQSIGKTFDWTLEREWRHAGDVDLSRFDPQDVRLFVADEDDARCVADRFGVSVVGQFAKPPRRPR